MSSIRERSPAPSAARCPGRVAAVIAIAVALAMLMLLGPLLVRGWSAPATAARAASAPACAGETNLFRGVCYSTARGQHWLGTITAANGKHFICVDFGKDARLGRYDTRSIKGVSNQLGRPVGDPELRALSYAYATYTAGGTSGAAVTDAALSLIAREVFADTSLFPRITVADQVKDAAFDAGAAVLSRARGIWRDATDHTGPYVVQVRGMPDRPAIGDSITLTVHLQSAGAAGSHPMRGFVVRLRGSGFTVDAGDGAATDAGGDVAARVTYRGPGAGTLTAEVAGLPGTYANLAVPEDRSQQRGLIETAATVTAQATVSTAPAAGSPPPQVRTLSSSPTAAAGQPVTDTVLVSGATASYATTVTATLFGPYAARPGADACDADRRAGSVTFEVSGDGEFRTPPVAVTGPGFYVWQESLAPDVDTGAPGVVTPCGVAEETTVVLAAPAITTQASARSGLVGESLSDTVALSAALPRTEVSVHYRLLGPVAPSDDGSCADRSWASAAILAEGSVAVVAGDDGSGAVTTEAHRIPAAGCFTFVESADPTPTSSAVDWTAPGLATETALVRGQPAFVTEAHAQHATRGAQVYDLVSVSGTGGAVIAGQWRLLGVAPPRRGGCAAVTPALWARARTLAHGVFTARGDGTVRTGASTLTRSQCITYVEHGDATATTLEVPWTTPGIPSETQLVAGGRTPEPSVPFVQVPAGGGSTMTSPEPRRRPVPTLVVGLAAASATAVLAGLAVLLPRRRRGLPR